MSETRTRVLHWFVSGGVAKTPEGGQFTIDVDALVIGRDPGANIVVADPEVSAFHCELRAVGEGLLVKDLGSTNGTYLGPVRVREAIVSTPSELTVGRSKIFIEPQAKRRVEVAFSERFGPLVGGSPKMRRVFGILEKVANTPLSVLIVGETGTGKELVAKAIHDASDRSAGPFVVVDCGSIPPTLAESILFGHEKGAFTGATERRKGGARRGEWRDVVSRRTRGVAARAAAQIATCPFRETGEAGGRLHVRAHRRAGARGDSAGPRRGDERGPLS